MPPNAQLWDEFNPRLYRLSVTLQSDADDPLNQPPSVQEVDFGLRFVGTSPDKPITINGRKTFFAGRSNPHFSTDRYPPTDVESWRASSASPNRMV